MSVSGDGIPARPATVAHIGVFIDSPDGTGFINNYTLTYASNHPELTAKLHDAGVGAVLDTNLFYQYSDTIPPANKVFAAITPPNAPEWFVHGKTGASFGPPALFLANWWRVSSAGTTKMDTTFPEIEFFDASDVSFITSPRNFIGNLIGGPRIGTFVELPVRGKFASATMKVTVQ
jgi:hypothetical protein